MEKPAAPAAAPPTDRLERLKQELAAAVAAEEFERAAELRDQIKAMEGEKDHA